MNHIFVRKTSFWLSNLTAIAILGTTGLPTVAQTADTIDNLGNPQLSQTSTTEFPNPVIATEATNQQLPNEPTTFLVKEKLPNIATIKTASRIFTPVPGTVETTAAAFAPQSPESTPKESTSQPANTTVAQADIDPGRPTRGGRSYIGLAGNIGLSGSDSALGDGNFAVISKIGLTNAISFRPAAILGDNTTIVLPLTYDFTFQQVADPFSEPLPIAPYVGVGAAIKTGDNSEAAFLLSGGIDVPLTSQFTGTVAVNAGFFENTDIGLMVGVGYNFSGF
ncbi:hypothetical protein H6G41_27260 [Tolypothrix sp. FACHB-123]|uniref:hypothetical protein n=1 Tax=Tolypothrix sp. FACHB-123 TaxID=2692868 RepID=UPI00168869BB|nr:hypothetical protein [Tolypothrix sp. FACHB-123]MBD2358265.1 hypothetical protein [Tolypothrix sp. FACHB-123]